ncbi:MAG: glycoside hydrolase family 97 N-terminal domain-containing protein [Bacteroidota bacterium]
MKNLTFLILALFLFSCAQNQSATLQSPDGKIQLHFEVNDSSQLFYSINYNKNNVIRESQLGFQFSKNDFFGRNLEIVSSEQTSVDTTWKPVYGEQAEIRNHYNQLKVQLRETTFPGRKFKMTFRVYNEGVAFNYTFLPNDGDNSLTIEKELTEFNFPTNYKSWVANRAQAEYRKIPVNEISEPAERPLVIEAGDNFLAIGEAKLIDFSRMKLQAGEKDNSLVAALHNKPTVELPYTTPWRTIMIGNSPGELLANNYFLLNLNDPCAIEDVSWIIPGKVIREVTLTTEGGMACVDFAAENGLQYVEFDAGWYGPEGDEKSDATTVTVDPARSPGPLDMHRVIEYAESQGIGIIVYVNRRALEKQIDEILPLYKTWGIKGMKYGFVRVGDQEWTTWLHEAVKKAADNHLMVDIHDEYRPTGFSRTYPNLMTQEGIRGDEESPSNEHTLITLFTRMLAGAGDNTICYYAPRVTEEMGGHVSQLAKAVMMYSPLQFLYWYDRPPSPSTNLGGVPGSDGYIQDDPELEFFNQMPTVWDETKVLEGKPGEYATIIRRSGDKWFLGSLTGEESKTLELDLSFLDSAESYEATIYTHDENSPSSTNVGIENREVYSETELKFELAGNSGLAIHFQKN